MVGALRLRGALHREALQGALQLVMERHDALRTHFAVAQDGSLEQVCRLVNCDSSYLHMPFCRILHIIRALLG